MNDLETIVRKKRGFVILSFPLYSDSLRPIATRPSQSSRGSTSCCEGYQVMGTWSSGGGVGSRSEALSENTSEMRYVVESIEDDCNLLEWPRSY